MRRKCVHSLPHCFSRLIFFHIAAPLSHTLKLDLKKRISAGGKDFICSFYQNQQTLSLCNQIHIFFFSFENITEAAAPQLF